MPGLTLVSYPLLDTEPMSDTHRGHPVVPSFLAKYTSGQCPWLPPTFDTSSTSPTDRPNGWLTGTFDPLYAVISGHPWQKGFRWIWGMAGENELSWNSRE